MLLGPAGQPGYWSVVPIQECEKFFPGLGANAVSTRMDYITNVATSSDRGGNCWNVCATCSSAPGEMWGFSNYCRDSCGSEGCGFYCWRTGPRNGLNDWRSIMNSMPKAMKEQETCARAGGTFHSAGYSSQWPQYNFCCGTSGSAWNPVLVGGGWSYHGGFLGCSMGFSSTP